MSNVTSNGSNEPKYASMVEAERATYAKNRKATYKYVDPTSGATTNTPLGVCPSDGDTDITAYMAAALAAMSKSGLKQSFNDQNKAQESGESQDNKAAALLIWKKYVGDPNALCPPDVWAEVEKKAAKYSPAYARQLEAKQMASRLAELEAKEKERLASEASKATTEPQPEPVKPARNGRQMANAS